MAKYIRIDLLEPISDMVIMEDADADRAVEEFRDFLMNEFDNHHIQAIVTIVDEPEEADHE